LVDQSFLITFTLLAAPSSFQPLKFEMQQELDLLHFLYLTLILLSETISSQGFKYQLFVGNTYIYISSKGYSSEFPTKM
jgi:hypothetical protein